MPNMPIKVKNVVRSYRDTFDKIVVVDEDIDIFKISSNFLRIGDLWHTCYWIEPILGGCQISVTGAFGEAEAGGWWIPELKFAGFDAILIKGRAKRPVYLWIHEGDAEIRDASPIWGKLSKETQDEIRRELRDDRIRIALIGPAGERKVKAACILNELKHVNGRTGLGAVMGSKNLKAIAVRGKKRMEVADEESVKRLTRWLKDTYEEPYFSIGNLGTSRVTTMLSEQGILPTLNFREGSFAEADAISGETMSKTILIRRGTCYGCFVRCKREVQVEEPYFVEPIYGGPEYETVAAFGSMCGIDDLKAISWANQLCNAYGLDTISTGGLISFAMECFEKGLITEKDTGGLKLEFGNDEALVKTVDMLCRREGFGDLLAEGCYRAARKIGGGTEQYAMHVKGLEFPIVALLGLNVDDGIPVDTSFVVRLAKSELPRLIDSNLL
jgi:aldehyde:ferredoxin oxidoreductase